MLVTDNDFYYTFLQVYPFVIIRLIAPSHPHKNIPNSKNEKYIAQNGDNNYKSMMVFQKKY